MKRISCIPAKTPGRPYIYLLPRSSERLGLDTNYLASNCATAGLEDAKWQISMVLRTDEDDEL